MAILVSGGAGYIGSHTCVELLAAGYDIVVADNFYNSCPKAVERVKQISGKDFRFYEADMTKAEDVEKVFAENPDIDSVIHFAAYKAVGESVAKPLEYYTDNLTSTLVVLAAMRKHGVHNFVFSSSATVYGDPASVPINESFPVGGATNPYGATKVMNEQILTDCCKADPELNVALLRYFNPIGAHKSGLIGEDPTAFPTTWCPTLPRWLWASWKRYTCTATITPPPTAPACGITSMWWTWPAAMWRPSRSWRRSPACSFATWAPARGTACWT